jgi:hypothetical protein
MAKKKKPMTVKARVSAHRKRLAETGYRNLQVQVSDESIEALDRLAKAEDISRSRLIERLIEEADKAFHK